MTEKAGLGGVRLAVWADESIAAFDALAALDVLAFLAGFNGAAGVVVAPDVTGGAFAESFV